VACGKYTKHSLSAIEQLASKFLPLIYKLPQNSVSETTLETSVS